MSKDALSLAREFVATVDRLATVPGMLASYDLGKLAICRGLIEAHAHIAVVTAQRDELLRAMESMRDQCSAQRADWLKESRGAPSKMLQASCAMAAGSFGTVMEWLEEAIARAQSGQPAPTCRLCSLPMPDGTDGHGLGECVPVCPTCDGSGTAPSEQPAGAPWGIDGQRDPDHPCDMFRYGKPSESNTCEGDGHALCNECGHYRCDPPETSKPVESAPCACCDQPSTHIGSDGVQRCSTHTLNGDMPASGGGQP